MLRRDPTPSRGERRDCQGLCGRKYLNETVRARWQTTRRSVLFTFGRVFFCGNLRSSADDPPFRGDYLNNSFDRARTPDSLKPGRSAQREKTIGPQITQIYAEKTRKPRRRHGAADVGGRPHPIAACRGCAENRARTLARSPGRLCGHQTTTSCGRRSATHNFCWGLEENCARRLS